MWKITLTQMGINIHVTPYPPTVRALRFFIPICRRKGYGYFYEMF